MRLLLLAAFIFADVFFIYHFSWDNAFVLDDLTKIEENSDLKTPFELQRFFYPYSEAKMQFRNDPSRPLVYMAYWACWQIGEGSPFPFHILNTAAHALTALLLAWLTMQLGFLFLGEFSYQAGGVAAILFATAPLIAGTVIYPFGLSDILGSMFSLACMVAALAASPQILISVAMLILALFSKQSAVVTPFLIVAIDYFADRMNRPRATKLYVPLFATAAFYLAARFAYFGGVGDLEGTDQLVPTGTYFLNEGLLILKYIRLMLIPVGLTVDHMATPFDWPAWTLVLAWLAIATLTFVAYKSKKTTNGLAKLAGLAWTLYLIAILPVSSVLPTVDLFVERRAYFPTFAIFALLGLIVKRGLSSPKPWRGVTVNFTILLIAASGTLAAARSKVYANSEKLWQESLAIYPDNPRALINLGVWYSRVEKWDESLQMFDRLLKLQPENGSIYTKIAYVYQQKKFSGYSLDKAWEFYKKGLELLPENIFALYNVGVLKMEQRQFAEAEKYFNKATELSPQLTKAWVAAGQAAWEQGDKARAVAYFQRALLLDANSDVANRYMREAEKK